MYQWVLAMMAGSPEVLSCLGMTFEKGRKLWGRTSAFSPWTCGFPGASCWPCAMQDAGLEGPALAPSNRLICCVVLAEQIFRWLEQRDVGTS